MTKPTATGLAGEYIAAASILQIGWHVSLAQQDCVDLVTWRGPRILRVQVKTRATADENLRGNLCFRLSTNFGGQPVPVDPQRYDILCLTCFRRRRCLFWPARDLAGRSSMRVAIDRFTADAELQSFESAVSAV